MVSDGLNVAAVDDELGAVNRRCAIRSQVGDDIGHFLGLGRAADRDPAQTVKDDALRLLIGTDQSN